VDFLTDDSLLVHRGAKRRLTSLRIALPHEAVVSSAPAALLAAAGVGLTTAEGPHLEMEWDAGSEGRAIDFSDVLPISIRW
jgi:hypothetical protein